MAKHRIEKDSMGKVKVPAAALYGAQTQRAVENFPISGIRFSRPFIRALGLIKRACGEVNQELGQLEESAAKAIAEAAGEVAEGRWDDQFPIDVFQTGSGTSTNMNANEVIAARANQLLGDKSEMRIHPNDHVNMGQSSNDVIPTAIHVAACLQVNERLMPSLRQLRQTLEARADELHEVIKTGRTHLMDAMPVRMSQELGGWAHQVKLAADRTQGCMGRMGRLPLGGTAVGTGINAHPEFGARVARRLSELTDLPFQETDNHMSAQATMDIPAELSAQLKVTATAFMKIANDLRWMNSGPIAGLGEIQLPSLQPGSSIMPGKVNPVISEAVMMVCAQVMGNDLAVSIGNERGNFQLNVMLPVIAHNLLQSIDILANAASTLAEKAIEGFSVNEERITELVDKNPVLVTALNPVIGYEKGAKLAKQAFAEGRRLKDLAREQTDLSDEELERLLDPRQMTDGGIMK